MIFEQLAGFFVYIISALGYLGVFFLMVLESMVFPVPSELVMPFAGFLVADGKMAFWLAIVASSLGSITGSLISYYVAFYGGKEMVHRFGKILLLDEAELEWTEQWFKKKGSITILISRFIPVVRHIISLPAGLGRMNIKHFVLYTLIGATAWNAFLLWAGMKLREKWEIVHNYSSQLDIIVVALLVLVVVFYVYRHLKKARNRKV
jgi:membrane protein DedA with SNARE-associated domain